jgi:hypothetical protein
VPAIRQCAITPLRRRTHRRRLINRLILAAQKGVEILYSKDGAVDLGPLKERYQLDIEIPFTFAA